MSSRAIKFENWDEKQLLPQQQIYFLVRAT